MSRGYLLPEGEAYTDDFSCEIVFYPNRPEYRRALLGSLEYLGTWVAWERDADRRGKDAARAWKQANLLTEECWAMGCINELIDVMEQIRLLLAYHKDCCDQSILYEPPAGPVTEIVPDVGDPPATYGETTVSDWDEWKQYLCHNAVIWVDDLIARASDVHESTANGYWNMGQLAAMLSALWFLGFIGVGYFVVATILAALLGAASDTFEDVAATFSAARDDLICVIIKGGDLGQAIEDLLESGPAWDVFYSHIDYEEVKAILYEGGHDGEYLPAELSTYCESIDCDYEQLGPEDVYIQVAWGYTPVYDPDTGIYTTTTKHLTSGCDYLNYYFKEYAGGPSMPVRLKLLSCTDNTTCGGVAHTRTFHLSVPVYSLNHPTLATPGHGALSDWYETHHELAYISFRLYAA